MFSGEKYGKVDIRAITATVQSIPRARLTDLGTGRMDFPFAGRVFIDR